MTSSPKPNDIDSALSDRLQSAEQKEIRISLEIKKFMFIKRGHCRHYHPLGGPQTLYCSTFFVHLRRYIIIKLIIFISVKMPMPRAWGGEKCHEKTCYNLLNPLYSVHSTRKATEEEKKSLRNNRISSDLRQELFVVVCRWHKKGLCDESLSVKSNGKSSRERMKVRMDQK